MMEDTTTVLNKVNTKVVCPINTYVLNSAAMNTTYGQRLRAARKQKGFSQNELADASGVKQGTISKIERGDQENSTFDLALADALGIHPLWLKNGDERYTPIFLGGSVIDGQCSVINDAAEKYLLNKQKAFPRVVGTAMCGDQGYYMELGYGDGYIEFDSAPGSIAIKIKGHSMHPAIREGWFVVIEPNRQPIEGEYVLAQFKDGKKMVKELLMKKPDSYLLLSVNGDERITAYIDDLENIQAVSAIVPPSKHRDW